MHHRLDCMSVQHPPRDERPVMPLIARQSKIWVVRGLPVARLDALRARPGRLKRAPRALEVDVISVTKIASMLEKANENTRPRRARLRPLASLYESR
jgi:hypothetical protein